MPAPKGKGQPKAKKSKAAQNPAPTVFSQAPAPTKPEGYVFGRPSLYDPKYCELAIEAGKNGKSKVWIAAEIGISRKTIDNWAAEHPDFLRALEIAKAYEQRWWEEAGQTGLGNGTIGQAIWSRNMAARFREDWTERNETALTGSDGGAVLHTIEFAVVEASR